MLGFALQIVPMESLVSSESCYEYCKWDHVLQGEVWEDSDVQNLAVVTIILIEKT